MQTSSKSNLCLLLIVMIVLTGAIAVPLSSPVHHLHAMPSSQASLGLQLQELWHTDVQTPSQLGLIGANCDGLGGVSDLTYASGTIFETFLYHGICTAQPPNLTNGFDAATGAPVWNKNQLVGGSGSGWQAPLVSNGILVVPNAYAWTGSAWVEAFDATNDQTPELWTAEGTDVAVDNGFVYAQLGNNINSGPEGSIDSYDLKTGQIQWQNTNKVCDSFQNPKIEVYNGVVYYIGCQNPDGTYSIQARNITDGSLLWSKNVSSSFSTYGLFGLVPSSNSTLISNGSIFVVTSTTDGSNNPTISSFSTTDGSQNWSKTLADTPSHGCLTNDCTFIGQIIASGSTVYVLEDMSFNHDLSLLPSVDIYALDASSGSERWHKSITINANITNGNYAGNTAYHGTLVNNVLYFNLGSAIYAFDAAIGNQLMMDDTVAVNATRHPITTPLVVGNTLYLTGIGSGQFTLYAYKIIGQQSINLSPTSGPSGSVVSVTGSGWMPGDVVDISLSPSVSVLTNPTVASDGTFTTTFDVPENATIGAQIVNAKDETTGQTAQASFTVTPGPYTVTTGANCSSPKEILGPIGEIETIDFTAVLTTTDPTESSQGEPLVIRETKGPFTDTITAYNKSLSTTFTTAAPGDTLTACIVGANGDESATITFTLVTISNDVWAGYLSTGRTSHPVLYSDVKGSWTIPEVKCFGSLIANSSFWVGLGGIHDKTLEQIGTESNCRIGLPSYDAVFEMVPLGLMNITKACPGNEQPCMTQDEVDATVKAGDSMQAEVLNFAPGMYRLKLQDLTQNWNVSTDQGGPTWDVTTAHDSAECIAERPPQNVVVPGTVRLYPLANFGVGSFTSCVADGYPIGSAGPLTVKLVITSNGNSQGSVLAEPGVLSTTTGSFAVTWKASGHIVLQPLCFLCPFSS